MNQLMLATSFHACDTSTSQRAQRIRRYPTLQRRVQKLDALDDCVSCRIAKGTNSSLDLWKLRHVSTRDPLSCVVDSDRSVR